MVRRFLLRRRNGQRPEGFDVGDYHYDFLRTATDGTGVLICRGCSAVVDSEEDERSFLEAMDRIDVAHVMRV